VSWELRLLPDFVIKSYDEIISVLKLLCTSLGEIPSHGIIDFKKTVIFFIANNLFLNCSSKMLYHFPSFVPLLIF
jgi:hypothetical protein